MGITQHRVFLAGINLKGIEGLLESAAGISLLSIGTAGIKHLIWLWTSDVLSEDSDNLLAHHVAQASKQLHTTTFIAIYLILHGALKLGLVAGMLKRIRWAYPLAAAILTAFIGYQIFRLTYHFSVILICLTCIDGLIVWLILLEYTRIRRSTASS
jgi:uncharacterized membrane protein